jgi:cytidyltransferase-like protein
MWHFGHVNMCKQARSLGDYLIIGITPDELCETYKRKPVLTTDERVQSARGCKWVDEVLHEDVELAITKEFIEKQ